MSAELDGRCGTDDCSEGMTTEAVRQQFWRTLVGQVDNLGVLSLLPTVVQAMLAYARAR